MPMMLLSDSVISLFFHTHSQAHRQGQRAQMTGEGGGACKGLRLECVLERRAVLLCVTCVVCANGQSAGGLGDHVVKQQDWSQLPKRHFTKTRSTMPQTVGHYFLLSWILTLHLRHQLPVVHNSPNLLNGFDLVWAVERCWIHSPLSTSFLSQGLVSLHTL